MNDAIYIVLLVSVIGNIFSLYLLSKQLTPKVSSPKQLYEERKKGLVPFVTPMKDSDQRDLSEIDDEVLKESIKKTINEVPEMVDSDDEEQVAKEKEFMI